jgi:hypothetical protein
MKRDIFVICMIVIVSVILAVVIIKNLIVPSLKKAEHVQVSPSVTEIEQRLKSAQEILKISMLWDKVTFSGPEGRQIIFGKAEYESMSAQELTNLVTLIDLCKITLPAPDIMQIFGEKLLPRFFITPPVSENSGQRELFKQEFIPHYLLIAKTRADMYDYGVYVTLREIIQVLNTYDNATVVGLYELHLDENISEKVLCYEEGKWKYRLSEL